MPKYKRYALAGCILPAAILGMMLYSLRSPLPWSRGVGYVLYAALGAATGVVWSAARRHRPQ